MRYRIFDPTGNVTALVEDRVDVASQPDVAACVMEAHPAVEQVGFVAWDGMPTLRMAGGEFCGNASMCAAVWAAGFAGLEPPLEVELRVSGTRDAVRVRVSQEDSGFATSILMPPSVSVDEVELVLDGLVDVVPVVCMGGITHAIVEDKSQLFALCNDAPLAERAVRQWCERLGADCLGLMFVRGWGGVRDMTPLVYVPGGDTLFWERSCASGSAAVGMWARRSLELRQPGGTLRVEPDGATGRVWLHGHVRV